MNEEEIFHEALARSCPTERAAYLDRACAGDSALRASVEALLQANIGASGFLDRLTSPLPGTADEPIAERAGTVIGPYKLMEQIGEGGMGLVFVAEQQRPVRRKVALKVIKPGMDTRQVVARFEAERQALALMDHPNIAQVLDAGTTVGGRPYFVMELVKGVPVTEYCDQNQSSIRERLELFVSVCQAVQHAHQKAIIHRDLKPSNVLVMSHDGTPVVKMIDFGVAKAIGQQLTDKTIYTQFSQMVGTPLYMSPEQAEQSGLDVDTRSDIYSLGVLLYELLTGTTPFDRERMREVGYDEMRRIIREEEPPKPSTRISTLGQAAATVCTQRRSEPKRLSQLFRGELDWIVMKALEKDRNRRYETASAFAADVQRYLHDEPVLACPPSAGYRLRKFARRNKGRLAVAGLVLFFLVSLGGIAGWAAWERAERRHEAALQQAKQRAALEADISRDLDEARAFCRQDRLREASAVLDHAQALADRQGADEDLGGRVAQLRKNVDMVASLEAIRLEKAAIKDGHFDWEGTALRYAKAFRDYGLDPDQLEPDKAAARIEVSAIREQLVAALDDWLIATSGRNRERLLAVLARADADPWRQQLRVAFVDRNLQALRELARAPDAFGQPPGTAILMGGALHAVGEIELPVEFLRRAQREHPDDFWLNCHLGAFLYMHLKSPQAAEAVGYLRAALALRPDSPVVLLHLGIALHVQGDLAGAIAAYRKAIALKPNYATAHNQVGIALAEQGDLPGAIAGYQKAIALKPAYAEGHANLGDVLQQQGDLAGAIAAFKKAIALKPDYATAHNRLGIALAYQRDLSGAIAAFKKAIALKPDLSAAHYNLGLALRDQGDLPGALAAYQQAITLKPDYALAHNNLGNALRDQGDLPGALTAYRKAIALKPDFAEAHCNLGSVLQQQGEFAKALEELRRGHELGSKDPRWRYPSAQWLRQCQRLLELDGRLSDILAGKATPTNAGERIELALLCAYKQRNGAALRFYQEAFAAQPTLLAAHRYNAACAAALAGCGQGQDADKLDDKERIRLRRQALDWLRADREAWARLLTKEPDKGRPVIVRQMQHWLVDADFAGVRGPQALAKLPESERKPWQKLWDDVTALRNQAQGKIVSER